MELLIRRAAAQDASAVLAYSRVIGAETRNVTYGPEGIRLSEEEERRLLAAQEQSGDTVILTAFDGEELVGLANVFRISQKTRLAHRAGIGVSVKKSHWNRGIATALMERCIKAGGEMGCTVLELEVLECNAAAIHLYEKLGFQKIGRFEKFMRYEDGTSAAAWLMNLYL